MRWGEDDAKRVGRWVVQARKRRTWTQEDLAHEAGLSKNTVGTVETANQGPEGFHARTLSGIEKALAVPRGTLQRIADGEDISLQDVEKTEADREVLTELSRLVELVDGLERRIRRLETRDG